MANYYLQDLKELEQRCEEHALGFSEWISDRLNEKGKSMINAKMSDNDYIKVNELYYRKYRYASERAVNQDEYDKAMMFCILRIQQLTSYKLDKRYRSYFPMLTFSRTLDEKTREFNKRKRPYYQEMKDNFKKKMIKIALLITIIFMILFVLVFKMHFLVGWILSILVGSVVYAASLYLGFVRVFEDYMSSMSSSLDKTHKEIDQSVRNV